MNLSQIFFTLTAALFLGASAVACGGGEGDDTVEQSDDALHRVRVEVVSRCYSDPRGSSFCPQSQVWCCGDPDQPRSCGCNHLDDVELAID